MKVKVDISKVDEKYRSLVKPEMTREELAMFGTVLLKDKIANLKYKLYHNKFLIVTIMIPSFLFLLNLWLCPNLFGISLFLLGFGIIIYLLYRSVENETKGESREDN